MEEVTVINLDDTTITVHNMVVNVGPTQHHTDNSSVPPYVWVAVPFCILFVILVIRILCFFENLSYRSKDEIKSFFKRPIIYIVNKIKRG